RRETRFQVRHLPRFDRVNHGVELGTDAELAEPAQILVRPDEVSHLRRIEVEAGLGAVDAECFEAERIRTLGLEPRAEGDREPLHPVVAPARGEEEIAPPTRETDA